LTSDYRDVLQQHRRAGPDSSSARRLEHELEAISDRFERLIAHAAIEEEARAAWRKHLRHGAPAPSEPDAAPARLVFRGRSESGVELEVRELTAHEFDVFVDGRRVERLARASVLDSTSAGLELRVGGQHYLETFEAGSEAIEALRSALERGLPAPVDPVLLRDGLVDRNLGLTARGRRAVGIVELLSPTVTQASEERTPVEIVTRGPVGKRSRERLRRELARLAELSPRPVLGARGSLDYDENPSLARPVEARASLDLGSLVVRAHASAAGTSEAVDLLVTRLRRELRELRERRDDRRRGTRAAVPREDRPA
jgi:ribosome-associated translation inhibitor RaiA